MTRYAFIHAGLTHAHPPSPPTPSTPRTPPERYDPVLERLSSIYYNDLFRNGFQIRGLPGTGRFTAAEAYYPEVRRSRFNNELPVNHLDVVSCWRGLNADQAEEVITWERVFREAIEKQISDDVRDLVPTLPATDDGTFKITHYFDIDLEELIDTMITLYFICKPDLQREQTWSMSGGDLPGFAYNFVRTRDCFIDASPRPYVQVVLSLSVQSASITGDVIWQPPNIDFNDLPTTLPIGALYSIHPDYRLPDYGNTSGPRFAVSPDYVEFMADSHCLQLEWSHAEGSFNAVVSNSNTSANSISETTLTAKRTMHFPGGVRYERTSRYNVRLLVTTLQELNTGNHTPPTLSQRIDSTSPEKASPASLNTAMSLDGTVEIDAVPDAKVISTGPRFPSYEEWKKENLARISALVKHDKNIAHASDMLIHHKDRPSKRKAGKQVPISSADASEAARHILDKLDDDRYPEIATKRQRLQQMISERPACSNLSHEVPNENDAGEEVWTDKHLDDLGHLSTTCVGEAQAGCPTQTSRSPKDWRLGFKWPDSSKCRAYTSSTGTSRVMPALRKKGSVKRILFNRPGGTRRADSPVEKAPSPKLNDENSMPACLEDLELLPGGAACDPDQAAICRNYDEFVRNSSHSRMGSDEAREAKEYESFFLEGSPSGASSVSEGMSAMSLDAD